MTANELKDDLKRIRDYVGILGETRFRKQIANPLAQRTKEYEAILATGPPLYLKLFKALYIEGKEQKALIEEWGIPRSTVSRKHNQMIEYLLSHLQI